MNGKISAAHFHIEYRTEKRCLWTRHAEIHVADQAAQKARTCDISRSGINVITEAPIAKGVDCVVSVAFFLHDDYLQLKLSGQSIYCTLVGTEGFRTGIRYRGLDDATRMLIARLIDI